MTPKTYAQIRNLEDDELSKTIVRVRGEEGTWESESDRQRFMKHLMFEQSRRVPED